MLERFVFRGMRSADTDSGWNRPTTSGLNFPWPFPKTLMDNPTRWYRLQSTIVVWGVWGSARIVFAWANKMRTHNMEQFYELWNHRGAVPLLTVSNHNSCFDDPGIWGSIPFREMRHRWLKWRWAPCAAELCFTSPFHVKMFSLGRCVPICRGLGVYQQAVDYCLQRLNANEWVHFYPEGRVVTEDEGHVRWK